MNFPDKELEDLRLAHSFLVGAEGTDKNGILRRVFLSANTKPTEEEGRKALRRVLEYMERVVGQGVTDSSGVGILGHIANLFDPNEKGERKVVFRKLTQGHNDPVRDDAIADMVFWELYDFQYHPDIDENDFIRNNTKVWKAYENVGKKVGLTPERVKKICAVNRKRNRH